MPNPAPWQSRIAKVLKRRKQDMGDMRQLTKHHWTMLLALRESIIASVDADDQEAFIRQMALWGQHAGVYSKLLGAVEHEARLQELEKLAGLRKGLP